jgi:hypothetical protein
MRHESHSILGRVAATVACLAFALEQFAEAGTIVGEVQAVYNAPNGFQFNGSPVGVIDGPAFLIENTSGADITSVVFTVESDSLRVGTIAAHSSIVVIPGLSTDGQTHAGFFKNLGAALDTSDSGPNGDGVQFQLTGLQGAVGVDSGVFTPGATAGPSNDGTISHINFLGGGSPDTDVACNNCFGPKVVAELVLQPGVPEPSAWILLSVGMVLAWSGRRLQRANSL